MTTLEVQVGATALLEIGAANREIRGSAAGSAAAGRHRVVLVRQRPLQIEACLPSEATRQVRGAVAEVRDGDAVQVRYTLTCQRVRHRVGGVR